MTVVEVVGTTTGSEKQRPYINLASYNITSGHNGRLDMTFRELDRLNVDIALLTESKSTGGIYTCHAFGYNVFATEAPLPL